MRRGMNLMETFLAYANDFEKTYKDDDWTRLRQYFADDAVYEVKAQSFGCRLQGPDAIFKGIKKSLDGFDRRFESRAIQITSSPEIEGDEIRIGWEVTYTLRDLPPYLLRGRSQARLQAGKIVYLSDAYEPSAEAAAQAWQQANGVSFDPSYI